MADSQFDRRISKQDLFACLCVWLEESPLASTQTLSVNKEDIRQENGTVAHKNTSQVLNKVGAVVVDSNDRIVALDCSREGLHGVVNALVMYPQRLNGCVVFTSRKPCCLCTKYMVQVGISRFYYLPFEPEVNTSTDSNQCDQLIRICPIAQSVYIPTINQITIDESTLKKSPYTSSKGCHKGYAKHLEEKYWNGQWVEKLQTLWHGINTDNITMQILVLFEWLSKVTMVDVPNGTSFVIHGEPNGLSTPSTKDNMHNEHNSSWQEFAGHMSRLAQILSQRSDDPSRGVGAVITRNHDIVAVGWNGFPSKAMYGDFPRANDADTAIKEKKYPFSIHAEQSAIMYRFVDDINDKTTTLFVSKMPCDDCVPLIARVGIKNVVYPPPRPKPHSTYLKFGLLEKFKAEGRFKCYVSTNTTQDKEHVNSAVRNLVSNGTI